MSEIKWIKILVGIFDDEKIKAIDALPERDAIFVIWIKLLTLAGKVNNGGLIYLSEDIAYNDEVLAVVFNRPVSVVRLALQTFERFGMLKIYENKKIAICNWEKHQSIDALDKIREDTRLRVAKCRDNQKIRALGDDTKSINSNDTVTLQVTQCNDADIRIKKEELDKDNIYKKHNFIEPTIDEVKSYLQEAPCRIPVGPHEADRLTLNSTLPNSTNTLSASERIEKHRLKWNELKAGPEDRWQIVNRRPEDSKELLRILGCYSDLEIEKSMVNYLHIKNSPESDIIPYKSFVAFMGKGVEKYLDCNLIVRKNGEQTESQKKDLIAEAVKKSEEKLGLGGCE